jgi:hypothetical protein
MTPEELEQRKNIAREKHNEIGKILENLDLEMCANVLLGSLSACCMQTETPKDNMIGIGVNIIQNSSTMPPHNPKKYEDRH